VLRCHVVLYDITNTQGFFFPKEQLFPRLWYSDCPTIPLPPNATIHTDWSKLLHKSQAPEPGTKRNWQIPFMATIVFFFPKLPLLFKPLPDQPSQHRLQHKQEEQHRHHKPDQKVTQTWILCDDTLLGGGCRIDYIVRAGGRVDAIWRRWIVCEYCSCGGGGGAGVWWASFQIDVLGSWCCSIVIWELYFLVAFVNHSVFWIVVGVYLVHGYWVMSLWCYL